jgi:hypothetical protein
MIGMLGVSIIAGGAIALADPPADKVQGGAVVTTQPGTVAAGEESSATTAHSEGAIAPYQRALLDLAFEAATAIPEEPHLKDRSRAQEDLVSVCLRLDQPELAHRYVQDILDWRRGTALADFALYCLQHDVSHDVEAMLGHADTIANANEEWRRDRIRVKIAAARAWQGRDDEARALEVDVTDAESGRVDRIRAMQLDTQDGAAFDALFDDLTRTLSSGEFDRINNGHEVCVELFDRFYHDTDRRARIVSAIKSSWTTTPFDLRIGVLLKLAGIARSKGDTAAAMAFIAEADAFLSATQWTAEFSVPMRAKIAGARSQAGDTATARLELASALKTYEEEKHTIANIFRADVLRPVAEAYMAGNDPDTARQVYRRAVDAGAENPNARPRAVDLAKTCASMAEFRCSPDEALLQRLRDIRRGLKAPW